MSKRCKLQKEYYKEFGNYKGSGKYTDHYVKCLENKVLAINNRCCCKSDSELLPDAEKEKLIEDAYWLNLQNLSGREDFEEAFKLGIEIGVNETLEKLQG
ncbi:hypothetical protein [Tenacibaculum phage JQ]|nr:hypothetical protein [Tenacibaculum phage JQ]